MPRTRIVGLLLLTLVTPVAVAPAQVIDTSVHVIVGFGVDTLGTNHDVFALWRRYLSSRPNCTPPDSPWAATEQAQWPAVDILCGFVYQGFSRFTVVHLAPAVGLKDTYLIRTLVATVSPDQDVQPLALYRVYATREQGRWVLANALPRLTSEWNHETIGRITFVFPKIRRFDRKRAQATAAFVDSLAHAFGISPPARIGYYFTNDLIETLRAAGLEFFPLGSDTVGGRAQDRNLLVFIGSSEAGEAYRHEVAHVVLEPFLRSLPTAGLVREGLMTWTGGSAGLSFEQLLPPLKRYLDAHPDLTLESILSDPPPRTGTLDVGYDGLAVLCKMVYETGGLKAIRELASAGREPAPVLAAAARLLTIPENQLDARWRQRIATLAGRQP